jgi:hypothetical protein
MANLFSSVELVYTAPGQGVLSDDWKWVLRGSGATRPVLRAVPIDPSWRPVPQSKPPLLSSTNGLLRLSAGDSGASSALGNEPDLGTAFAVATSIYGSGELGVSGNVGYASSIGVPTAGFRTRYSSQAGGVSPNVELTVRQVAVRARAGQQMLFGGASGAETPLLRTMSVKVGDQIHITDDISLDYGALLEAVVFVERLNQVSPFARLNYDLGEVGTIEVGYSSGAPALDLLTTGTPGAQDYLLGLATFPRVSLSDGHARVQRSQNFEAGYRYGDGVRTFAASVFREGLRDSTITVSGAPYGLYAGDLLPDLSSPSSIFNLGSWQTVGYMASVSQPLGGNWSTTVAAGASGMLAPSESTLESCNPDELRSIMRPVNKPWAAARVAGQLPWSGTRVSTSYMWIPGGTLGPSHAWLTQRWQPLPGLNVQLRQPVPSFGLVGGRLEMTAEIRNLLAQGYVPVSTPDGSRLLLIQFPRSLRGGLSFIF